MHHDDEDVVQSLMHEVERWETLYGEEVTMVRAHRQEAESDEVHHLSQVATLENYCREAKHYLECLQRTFPSRAEEGNLSPIPI